MSPLRLPPDIDAETFLRDYWQRRPLLMRAALPPSDFALTPDELAGLSCEPEFESRLIIERAPAVWELRHGPFTESDFAALPETQWTLLVQDVDKFLPEVAALLDRFDFVPGWRVDDIMISYASDKGGVGPHTDAYDVFLMQGMGRRRWRLSYRPYTEQDLIPGLEQRILTHFEADEEWTLEPGDILYLPPGIAHWGIAEGDCMTYSLGFRAPSQREIAADWFQHLVALSGDTRLNDPSDLHIASLAELTGGIAHNAAQLLAELPSPASQEFRLWLGEYLTEPKPQFQILPPDEPWDEQGLRDWVAGRRGLARHPFARIAWMRLPDDEVALFCQGQRRLLPVSQRETVRLVAELRTLAASVLHDLTAADAGAAELLVALLNDGLLEPEGV
jgi:50S ribosomal protein L16 3-hydroxylase